LIAVAGMDVNVRPIPTYRPKIIGFVGVEIEEIKRVERRCDLQRARRTALDGAPGLLRDVNAGTAETVDVIFLEVGGPGESLRVGGTVLFDDLELELRPGADRVKPERKIGHARASNSCWRGEAGNAAGNWFHSSPSSNRPPDLGERPPHCLKKNATLALRHWLRTSIAQWVCMGRARGPLSPPTMTQSMPVRFSLPTGPMRGSTERKRTAA